MFIITIIASLCVIWQRYVSRHGRLNLGDTGIAGLAPFNFAITLPPVFMLAALPLALPAPRGKKTGLTQSHVDLEDVIVMSTSTCILLHAGLWLIALCLFFG